MNKQPQITEKTRQKFVDAFWLLIKEKPVSKIAVSELTRRVGCNRSTFYEYFLDIDDLLAYVQASLLEDIKKTILQVLPECDSVRVIFKSVFSAMNEKIYLMIGPNGDSGFFAKVRDELVPLIEDCFSISKNLPNFDYMVCFVNSAGFGLLQHWNEKGKDLTTEQIGEMIQNLVLNGLDPYISLHETEKS